MFADPDTKEALRRQALGARRLIDPAVRAAHARRLCAFHEALGPVDGLCVSAFLPIRDEIDPRPLMDLLERSGARLALPDIVDGQTIVFRSYASGDALREGGFKTMAPMPDAAIVDPDMMLMPLAAFDGRGNRIGYGGGYYDRAIARLHGKGLRPRLVGLAFACQQVPAFEPEPHDVPLNGVLTENGLTIF